MYRFKSSSGQDMTIRFSHKGGKKGTATKPGRAPKFTVCRVGEVTNDNETILATGMAKPVIEVAEVVPSYIAIEDIPETFGKRFIRSIKTDDGQIIALLRGDTFCRETGRKESLRKAIGNFDKATREAAWKALFAEYETGEI